MKTIAKDHVEEPSPKGQWDSPPDRDFITHLHSSPNSALKSRDCGLAPVQALKDLRQKSLDKAADQKKAAWVEMLKQMPDVREEEIERVLQADHSQVLPLVAQKLLESTF